MKTLMLAIQTALKNAATLSYVADDNIFITPDENIIPMVLSAFPAIALKDGRITRTRMEMGAGALFEVKKIVYVIPLVEDSAGETPIIGQTSPSIKGTLDMSVDIKGVLHENYLSISTIKEAICYDEEESEGMLFFPRELAIIRKKMAYTYTSHEVL